MDMMYWAKPAAMLDRMKKLSQDLPEVGLQSVLEGGRRRASLYGQFGLAHVNLR